MGFNQLPAGYDRAKLGPQKRRTRFKLEGAKLTYDAKNLIGKAELQSKRLGRPVDPITFAQREDDNLEALQEAIDKERGSIRSAVDMAETEAFAAEFSQEQIQAWLSELQVRFDALSQLHEGILWTDVERSLKADPESMKKLRALDEKGHQMNVFGKEGDEFIFVSAWDKYEQVARDHRRIAYDMEGQRLAEQLGPILNGNAVSIIAEIMGVEEDKASNYLADPKFHEQLMEAIEINGHAWLKTDPAIRKTDFAFCGHYNCIRKDLASFYDVSGSFRAELRVKKV